MPTALILAGLAILASLPPLLTFASLWQTKEWRVDRLREHFRSEGYVRQLFGIARPAAILLFVIITISGFVEWPVVISAGLWTLAGIAALQIQLKRQPMPKWTQKARVLVGTGIVLIFTAAVLLADSGHPKAFLTLLLLPLAAPFALMLAWISFWPIDRKLKRLILREARMMRERFDDITVIGITGSVGKTTTKELLVQVLQSKGAVATPAHVNSEVGVAQWLTKTLQGKPLDWKVPVIVEMGAYRKGEIALLCAIAKPTLGVVSFVGTQHIALFGSQQALCDAKGELVEALPAEGRAFLNADSSLCAGLKTKAKCPVTMVGTGGRADLEAFDIEENSQGIRFRAAEMTFTVPLHGTHNVTNVLLVIAVAQHLGMDLVSIAAALRSFTPPSHTFAVREEKGVTILDDTHNASPTSFKAAIAWAKAQPAEEKILVTPGLIEQGEEQDRVHSDLGASSANVFQRVIFLNKKSARSFQQGFAKPIELFGRGIPKAKTGSLVVAVGRMSPATLRSLLP